jgi:hypothetical protein
VKNYYEQGYEDPERVFPACFIIFRNHKDEKIIDSMEEWWNQISRHSRRDQLSFSFVAWKYNLDFTLVDYNKYFNKYFNRLRHDKIGLGYLIKLTKHITK